MLSRKQKKIAHDVVISFKQVRLYVIYARMYMIYVRTHIYVYGMCAYMYIMCVYIEDV